MVQNALVHGFTWYTIENYYRWQNNLLFECVQNAYMEFKAVDM